MQDVQQSLGVGNDARVREIGFVVTWARDIFQKRYPVIPKELPLEGIKWHGAVAIVDFGVEVLIPFFIRSRQVRNRFLKSENQPGGGRLNYLGHRGVSSCIHVDDLSAVGF